MVNLLDLLTNAYPNYIECDECGDKEYNREIIIEHVDSGEDTYKCSKCRELGIFGVVI